MEIINFVCYWMGLPFLIGCILFSIYSHLLHEMLGIEDDSKKIDYDFVDGILSAIFIPESMIWRLSSEKDSKEKMDILTFLSFLAIGFLIVSNISAGWNWTQALKETVIVLLAFGMVKRMLAVYQVCRLLKVKKAVRVMETEREDVEGQFTDLTKIVKKEKKAAAQLKKEIHSVRARNKQIYLYMEQLHAELEKHLVSYNDMLKIMNTNISSLRYWDNKNVRIAIDTNILMECDDYIMEELKRHKLLISKTVQGEWDYNIKKGDAEKKSKGKRARDRLDELVENGKRTNKPCDFIVKKWNAQFMRANNLRIDENDEKIIADYLYEYQSEEDIVILSADKMFTISASIHMPVIRMEKVNLFAGEVEFV
ncbi:hypothetical protein F9U64_20185 [Gracilibacillus oryzae]|uniref:PIN domain-containing protein n=1 Tax=Gracilibacillus oryzae TaxID=1672701 RepID=A0A7C8GQM5_9BACI|nr:PIN domain-containing protein [Gracilibacillus oryzae]KAB8126382.1 hypothetical protein F9U64_20185 [Gracilibacillus oryzae]